jgi:hypothetical protein
MINSGLNQYSNSGYSNSSSHILPSMTQKQQQQEQEQQLVPYTLQTDLESNFPHFLFQPQDSLFSSSYISTNTSASINNNALSTTTRTTDYFEDSEINDYETDDKNYINFKNKYDEFMIQHISAVAQNESINDLKIKYSIGYNLIKSKY